MEARRDLEMVRRIVGLTGLDLELVQNRLWDANGARHVRNVFVDEWPDTVALGKLTVAKARRLDLVDDIVELTGLSRSAVSRRLRSETGRARLRSVFARHWPDPEKPRARALMPKSSPARATRRKSSDIEGHLDRGAAQSKGGASAAAQAVDSVGADDDAVSKGQLINERYEIRRQLTPGGFANTFEAFDRVSNLNIVLKFPKSDDGGAVERELRHAFRLLHPSICQAFPERNGETGRPFLVLQHGGEDLSARLARVDEQPISLSLAIHILESVADALDYLHDRLVVHLDVSPNNVLIDADDNVRLTDFGASSFANRQKGVDGQTTRMATTVSAYTPAYSAPELRHDEGRSRSDQYSLALLFCSLLEGRVFRQRYRFTDRENLTPVQNNAIRKALSQHPEERFPSCGDFACVIADEFSKVPTTVLRSDLERVSLELHNRLRRETKPRQRGAARLGSVVLVSRSLERFLHCTLLWMASTDGADAEEVLRRVDQKTRGLAKATSGQIASAIASYSKKAPSAARPEVCRIVDDLRAGSGRIEKLIGARNRILHGERQPYYFVEVSRDVAELLAEHRANAGWTE